MNTHYMLRKANGDILTVDVEGCQVVPVWESDTAVRRSKRANPDLVVYVQARLDRRLIERKFPNSGTNFFLVDSRDLDLQTGHIMSRDDLLKELNLAHAA